MVISKNRLCLAVYSRPHEPDAYDYALMECPTNVSEYQSSPVKKWHVAPSRNLLYSAATPPRQWNFEAVQSHGLLTDANLLALVVMGKVRGYSHDLERIVATAAEEQEPSFNTVSWAESATEVLAKSGLVVGVPAWYHVDSKARRFARAEVEWGRWNSGFGRERALVPVMDLVDGEMGQGGGW